MKIRNVLPAVISLFVIALVVFINRPAEQAVASVALSNEYQSTTTRSTSASATASWSACSSRSAVGSLVINQPATAGYVQIWDATSTATSTYASTDTSSSSPFTTLGKPIAKISSASDVQTTLTYDLNTYAGIVLETSSGFDGEYTFTYRCR